MPEGIIRDMRVSPGFPYLSEIISELGYNAEEADVVVADCNIQHISSDGGKHYVIPLREGVEERALLTRSTPAVRAPLRLSRNDVDQRHRHTADYSGNLIPQWPTVSVSPYSKTGLVPL